MEQKLAQRINIPGISPIDGPIPTTTPGTYKFETIGGFITELLKYIYPIAGFILFVFIIASGFQMLTANGDPKKIQGASARLTYAILGFILLVASPWIARIVELLFSPEQPFF